MAITKFLLLLGLVMTVSAYRLSSSCVELCKSESSTRCENSCDLEVSTLSSFRRTYGHDVVETCLTTCQCDKNVFAYSSEKFCQILQTFAIRNAGQDCRCNNSAWKDNLNKWNIEDPQKFAREHVIDYLVKRENVVTKLRSALPMAATVNPWEKWCRYQCAEGMGGSACYCDIIP